MNQNIIRFNLNYKKHDILKFPVVFTDEEVLTGILASIQPINRTFTIVVEHSDHQWILFSLLFYLEYEDTASSFTAFSSFHEITTRYFLNRFSNEEIFSLWMTNKSEYISPVVIKEIVKTFHMEKGVEDDYPEIVNRLKQQIDQEKQDLQRKHMELLQFIEFINRLGSSSPPEIQLLKKTIQFSYDPQKHSLGYYFDHVQLKSRSWDLVDFSTFIRISEFDSLNRDAVLSVLADYNHDNENRLFMMNSTTSEYLYLDGREGTLTVDMLPSQVLETTLEELFPTFPEMKERLAEAQTIYVSGTFNIKNQLLFNKILLQDIVLNDSFLKHFFVVNELEKANKFNSNTLHVLLDTRIPVTMTHTERKEIRIQFSKCSSDTDTKRVHCLARILWIRYSELWNDYAQFYQELLPKSMMMSTSTYESTALQKHTTDFTLKYKNLLRKTGFKTACRPKSRVPVLISESEAKKHTNPLEVLEYPRQDSDHMNDLDIPTEYFKCNDKNYTFPGISSLGGGQLFVPCCFNKNPRSSKAFLEYYFEKNIASSGSSSSTEHVKSDNQIIKKTGDLGRVYPILAQIFSALFPSKSAFRVGVTDSNNSILHAIGFLLGESVDILEGMMKQTTEMYPHLLNQQETDTSSNYIDPRKYLSVLQFMTNTNIVVFRKDKNREDRVDLLNPCFSEQTTFYRFRKRRPFIFLIEHWGSSPDRYTKRKFPICEPIAFSNYQELTILTKTLEVSEANFKMLDLMYNNRFSFSNQTFHASVDDIGINLNRIRYQIFDDSNRLRSVIVQLRDNKYVHIKSQIPLPPLPIKQETNLEWNPIEISDEMELSSTLKYIGCSATKTLYFAYLNQQFFVVIHTKTGCEWVIRTKRFKDTIYTKVCKPLIDEDVKHPSGFQWNAKMARVLMDYSLYLYRSASPFADEASIETFIKKVIHIEPGYKYPAWNEISERIDANPGIMRDSRLVVTNEIIRQKLYFHVLDYHFNHKRDIKPWIFLPHFYSKIWDFNDRHHLFDKAVFLNAMSFKKDGVVYLRISLSEWVHNTWQNGIWYNQDEIPNDQARAPVVFQKVKSQTEAIGVTWLWNQSHRFSIPMDVPEIHHVVTWVFNKENKQWITDTNSSVEEDRLNVYLLYSEQDMFVFLFG